MEVINGEWEGGRQADPDYDTMTDVTDVTDVTSVSDVTGVSDVTDVTEHSKIIPPQARNYVLALIIYTHNSMVIIHAIKTKKYYPIACHTSFLHFYRLSHLVACEISASDPSPLLKAPAQHCHVSHIFTSHHTTSLMMQYRPTHPPPLSRTSSPGGQSISECGRIH